VAPTETSPRPSTEPAREPKGLLAAVRAGLGQPPSGPREARRRWDALWRHRWLVIQAVVLVPVLATAYSLTRGAVFEDSAVVLLSSQTRGEAIAEAGFAKQPRFLAVVVAGDSSRLSPGAFGRVAHVSIVRTNMLRFSVDRPTAGEASRLATLWAYRFSLRRRADLLRAIRTRLQTLAPGGRVPRGAAPAVRTEVRRLRRSLVQPGFSLAAVLTAAHGADRITPRPARAALMGLLVGIILGLTLAFLADAAGRRRAGGEPRAT
jgi:hypothetical protein